MATNSRRLVLHIGPHKTASSYIQVNLKRARDALAMRGWLYPEIGTDGLEGHHHLAHNAEAYLPSQAPYHGALAKLGEAARAGGNNIVLSAEGLCRWEPSNFDRLADTLGFETYELIYVIRDPLDLFPSLWAEEIKQGLSLGFADRFAWEYADPMGSRIFNPMRDLHPLLARKRARVHAVPYDILKRRGIDIFEHLAGTILQLEGISAPHAKPVNVKYPIELTEFLRLMTLIFGKGQAKISPGLRLRFTERVSKAEQRELSKLVRENAAQARRVIAVPGDSIFRTRIEQILKAHLKDSWSTEVGEDEPLFSAELRKFVYYDSYLLSICDPVRQAAEDVVQRLTKAESLVR